MFPHGFMDLYEVHSYRNAANILSTACKDDFAELIDNLITFRIQTEDMVKSGGNKTEIAKAVDKRFNPLGWNETRIDAELVFTKHYRSLIGRVPKSGKNKGKTIYESEKFQETYRIPGFVDGHKIDFVKNNVAFDLEWNSKDQTFDRDLYAMRAFYDCNIIQAGVLLTRSESLKEIFGEIQNRVHIKDFKSKYGASTTWMGKLSYRLNAGRAGGCPMLVLGFKPPIVSDFETWKLANPVIKSETFDLNETVDEDA